MVHFACDQKLIETRYDVRFLCLQILPLVKANVGLIDTVWTFNLAAAGLENITADKKGDGTARVLGILSTHPSVKVSCSLSQVTSSLPTTEPVYLVTELTLAEQML
jgi:hypothetical protein